MFNEESKIKILSLAILSMIFFSVALTVLASLATGIFGFMSSYIWSYESGNFSIHVPWLAISILLLVMISLAFIRNRIEKSGS